MNRFIAIDHLRCTGCKTCEVVCSLYHFGECNPWKSAVRVIRRERDGLVLCVPLVCQQCERALCIEACPTGALSRDEAQGILTVDKDSCSACELCVEACPIGGISINVDQKVIISCDLCDGQPQCVPVCHAQCLTEIDSSQASDRQNVEYLAGVLKQEDLLKSIPGRRAG